MFSHRTRPGFGLEPGICSGGFECRSAGHRFVRGAERKWPGGDGPGADRALNDFRDVAQFTHHRANEAADLVGTELHLRLCCKRPAANRMRPPPTALGLVGPIRCIAA